MTTLENLHIQENFRYTHNWSRGTETKKLYRAWGKIHFLMRDLSFWICIPAIAIMRVSHSPYWMRWNTKVVVDTQSFQVDRSKVCIYGREILLAYPRHVRSSRRTPTNNPPTQQLVKPTNLTCSSCHVQKHTYRCFFYTATNRTLTKTEVLGTFGTSFN